MKAVVESLLSGCRLCLVTLQFVYLAVSLLGMTAVGSYLIPKFDLDGKKALKKQVQLVTPATRMMTA